MGTRPTKTVVNEKKRVIKMTRGPSKQTKMVLKTQETDDGYKDAI